ncbi:MAG: O-methyltransferase [Clostridia bacterium]
MTAKEINLFLSQMRQYALKNFVPIMLEDTEQLLRQLVTERQPKQILEIGTAIGYSGIIMLTASSNATLNTIEMEEQKVVIAKDNFYKTDLLDRVNFFLGDAKEIVPKLTGTYDFIFMDGPKGQYIEFLPYLLSVLKVGGTLVCDNVLYKGLVEHQPTARKHLTIARNMKKFLDNITNSSTLSTILYRVGDGVSVSEKLQD